MREVRLVLAVIFGGLLLVGLSACQSAGTGAAEEGKPATTTKPPEKTRAQVAEETSKEDTVAKTGMGEMTGEKTVARKTNEKTTREEAAPEEKRETADRKKEEKQPAGDDKQQEEQQASAPKPEEPALPPAPADPTMSLTIPKMGLYDNTVLNTQADWALNQGAIKLPSTGFPWQDNANTYVTGHRVGYSGTQSRYQFYELPALQPGDDIYLTDANGNIYNYHVTEVFAVEPTDVWVTNPVPGRDMITLQTCITSINDWWSIGPAMMGSWSSLDRLVVRADRVAINPT